MQYFGCSCCASLSCDKLTVDGFSNPEPRSALDLVVGNLTHWPDTYAGVLGADPDIFYVDTVPGDTTSTVNLTIGAPINGLLDTLGDHDWYRITLTAGQTYTFTVGPTGSGDIADSYLRLHNSTGILVAENDDINFPSNTYSRIVFTATSSGTYFVNVGAYDDLETGNFRITASVDVPDSIPGNSTTSAVLTVGGASVNGVTDAAGDHDWYRIDLVAGQTYTIRTNATGGPNDTDTYLRIYGTDGTSLLAQNDDGGGGTYSSIRFTATTTGTYFVDVGAFDDNGTGTYNVSAAVAPPLELFTNDQIADQLINGYWGGAANARHFNASPGGTITYNLTALTAAGQILAREAFALWSDATGITFSEVTTTAQITLDDNQEGAFASSTRVGNIISSSVVNVSTDWLSTYGTGFNTYSFQTYIHEIGHAIGLGHAGPYNGNATYGQDNSYLNDAWATTVMSYFDQTENTYFAGLGFTRQFVVSPIMVDVLAVNLMYGTPNTTRTGDTTYGFNNNSGRVIYDATQFPSVTYTVVDHGGVDTLDYSGFSQNQTINLVQEAFSSIGGRNGNVTIARGSVIENAIGGSGNDFLLGNASNNDLSGGNGDDYLIGRDGNDTLRGGGGTNTLQGGIGDDSYYLDNAGDSIIESAGEGTDTVFSNVAVVTLQSNVENLTSAFAGNMLGIGNGLNNTITGGNGRRDELYGLDGNDTLNDGGGANGFEDTMLGGNGDDIYIVGVRGSSTVEQAGGGTDTVHMDFSVYGLQANVENLTAISGIIHDAMVGNILNNVIIGSSAADGLYGREGNDTLWGGTGAANTLLGQEGDDRYEVQAAGDSVIEFAGQGSDIVAVSGSAVTSFTLTANVEHLAYFHTGDFTGIGNSLGNQMFGNIGQDFLSGLDGDDFLVGEDGNDTLLGGNGADQFLYFGGQTGIDRILDFTSGQDKISLNSAFYTPTGAVSFVQGGAPVANTANSTFLYDVNSGIVYYDDDGNGAGAAIAIAQLNAGLTLAAGDFIFF